MKLKSMWPCCVIALLFVATCQAVARASDAPPRILAVSIPGMVNADGSGSYLQLLHLAWEAKKLGIEVLPPKRAVKWFSEASKNTCLIPLESTMAEALGIDTRDKIFSRPFNTSFGTIISQRGSTPPQSLGEIEGQSVGVLQGFPIEDKVVAAAGIVIRPNSMQSLLGMLELGRIDFAYVHYPDLALGYVKQGISRFPESNMRFQIVADTVMCTADAADWIRRFDDSIDRMYENDTIRRILGPGFTGR